MSTKLETAPRNMHESKWTRSRILTIYLCVLGILSIPIFLALSADYYFNARTCQVLAWSYPLMACTWIVAYSRSPGCRNFMIPDKSELKRLKPWVVPFRITMLSGHLAFMCWLCVYGLASLLVLVTSRADAPITAPIHVVQASGRCPIRYSFFDPAIQRRVSKCGWPFAQPASGDIAGIDQLVGPFGMLLLSVSREQ